MAMTAPAVLYNGVYLNDYYYSNMNRLERIKTTIHEIGHILGLNEGRYAQLTKINPDHAKELLELNKSDAQRRYARYKKMAEDAHYEG